MAAAFAFRLLFGQAGENGQPILPADPLLRQIGALTDKTDSAEKLNLLARTFDKKSFPEQLAGKLFDAFAVNGILPSDYTAAEPSADARFMLKHAAVLIDFLKTLPASLPVAEQLLLRPRAKELFDLLPAVNGTFSPLAEYLAAAEHATALYLTYLQVWDIPLPPGRLADNGFRTAGWSAVSVQNMHLDVYGVWVAPLLWKIGKALRRQSWMDLALPTYINCAQLLDIRGSQGEQFEQTNFSQQPMVTELDQLRGGYSEKWVVFWITAAFLNSAAQFEMLGLSLFDQKM